MSRYWIAGAAALALALPAIAQMAPRGERAAQPVTRAELEARIKERFAKNDTNRDGALTREEMQAARAERREQRQDRAFAMMDADKNGQISRAEFDTARERRAEMRKQRGEGKRQGWRQRRGGGREGGMFARADANNDGRLTIQEMLAKPLTRFDAADTDRNGTLTPEERRTHREKMQAERRAQRG